MRHYTNFPKTAGRFRRRANSCAASHWTCIALALLFGLTTTLSGRAAAVAGADKIQGLSYKNLRMREVPWSIHIITIDRSHDDFELSTTLGQGTMLGLSPLTEQISSVSRTLGRPVAAINGDFYKTENETLAGDPRGLQIRQGELVSAPSGRACFWIDPAGKPQITNVVSQLKIIWPNGAETSCGLNEELSVNSAVLYTPTVGPSTQTRGGREVILERESDSPWLPLRVGQTYSARVREVRETGNARLTRDVMILSLGPGLLARVPKLSPGATLKISTGTLPDLSGVKTAIGGGPVLVRDGKPQDSRVPKSQERHPRAALGWNEKNFFFVEVDGRQPGLSMGMNLPELTAFLVQLGCQHAMNLDGGGSAEVWFEGRIVNSPCFGRERNTANSLVLLQTEKKGGQ